MKILTKSWFEQFEQVRAINWIKEIDQDKTSYEDVKKMSRDRFNNGVAEDKELAKLAFGTNLVDELYGARIERDKKTLLGLPKEILSKITSIDNVVLGYASKEDKAILTTYADKLYKDLEKEARQANRASEKVTESLVEDFDIDYLVGELVYEEYAIEKDYFLVVDGYTLCITDYEIVERENCKVNKWERDNPISLWTSLEALELYRVEEDLYEIHFIFVNGDKLENKTRWYLTLRGKDIKLMNK